MKDALTLANINLYAILRNLEDLCVLDEEMKSLIKEKNISIQFTIKDGPAALLAFKEGKCKLTPGKGKSKVKLYFKSPEHFNAMIEGKAKPIPLKGFTKLGFLTKEFTQLTDRLTYYLRPNDALLSDPTYFKINTYLSAYTAFFALAQIGNTDPVGKLNASRIPDGIISVSVDDGPALHLKVKSGNIAAKKGPASSYRASMAFNDIEVANACLTGRVDSYTCIATGKLQMKGYIPMLDNMNKLLGQVTKYLN